MPYTFGITPTAYTPETMKPRNIVRSLHGLCTTVALGSGLLFPFINALTLAKRIESINATINAFANALEKTLEKRWLI